LGHQSVAGLLSGIRELHTITPLAVQRGVCVLLALDLEPGRESQPRDGRRVGYIGGAKNPADLGLPYISVSGSSTSGKAYDCPRSGAQQLSNADSMTWIHGRHNLKFGADFLRYSVFQ